MDDEPVERLKPGAVAERWWPIAGAVMAAGILRATLPDSLRVHDAPLLVAGVYGVMLLVLVAGDPGRIDRQATWLRVVTAVMIGSLTAVNGASAVKLIYDIIDVDAFTNSAKTLLAAGGAIWATNVIAFALWYWTLDRGGAASRAHGEGSPAFVFPEMTNSQYVGEGWGPRFVDYFHLSFTTATAFSPTDVSAIRPWAKLLMMAEEAISLVLGLLVIARAVNILQ